jgi:hypothetical protein
MYLIFTHKKEESIANKETPILQAGFGYRNLKGFLGKIATFGGFLSALITVKNELKSVQIGKLDQLMEAERLEIRKSIDQDREGHQSILTSIEDSREELLKLHNEKAKIFGHNDRLLTLHNSIKNKILAYQEKAMDPDTKLSELGILDQLIKQDTNKFGEEISTLNLNTGPSLEEEGSINNINDLKESSILNFNFSLEWFEGVIFSALLSIIFVFYGNILIEKYDLENRYPKLAKLIQLRQKYQKYYFKYYCFLIISIILIEVAFALAILTL